MKRILILYTSVGLGHKIIAHNIAHHLEHAGYTVRLDDVLVVQKKKTVTGFISLQQFINRNLPFIWEWLYKWGYIPALPFRVLAGKLHSSNLLHIIKEYGPDLIISTQTAASAPIAYLKKAGKYRGPLAIAFSDYHFHPFWLYPGADTYLTTIPEQKSTLIKKGITEDTIQHVGMTLKPKSAVEQDVVRKKFSITQSQKVVLIGTGSIGTSASPDFICALVRTLNNDARKRGIEIKIIVGCGRNEEFKAVLERTLAPTEAIVLGYYTPMDELYSITDFFVTKPGGLSIAEGLQWNLPMLVTHWLPGQERLNYEYLKFRGLIMPGPKNPYQITPSEASQIVLNELTTGRFKASLIINPFIGQLLHQDALNHPVVNAIMHTFERFDGNKPVG